MALSCRRIEQIKRRIRNIENHLEALGTAIDKALASSSGYVSSYTFNSGEGQQSTAYRRLDEAYILEEQLEASLDRYYRKLEGTGLKNISLRRKRGE